MQHMPYVYEALVSIPSTTEAKMCDFTWEESHGKHLGPGDALASKQENHRSLKLLVKWRVRKEWEVLHRAQHRPASDIPQTQRALLIISPYFLSLIFQHSLSLVASSLKKWR